MVIFSHLALALFTAPALFTSALMIDRADGTCPTTQVIGVGVQTEDINETGCNPYKCKGKDCLVFDNFYMGSNMGSNSTPATIYCQYKIGNDVARVCQYYDPITGKALSKISDAYCPEKVKIGQPATCAGATAKFSETCGSKGVVATCTNMGATTPFTCDYSCKGKAYTSTALCEYSYPDGNLNSGSGSTGGGLCPKTLIIT